MRFLFLTVFLFSCIEKNEVMTEKHFFDVEQTDAEVFKETWVCYHPKTEFHNKLCVESEYPEGCYVTGDSHKFCWLLTSKDCLETKDEDLLEVCKNSGYVINEF